MFRGHAYDFRIGFQWRPPEVPEHGPAVARIDLLPASEQYVIERLEPVLLAARCDAGPRAAGFHHHREFGQDLAVFIQDSRLGHHVHVGADGPAGHRKGDHPRIRRGRDGVKHVVPKSLIE